jgi:hypothetical protein
MTRIGNIEKEDAILAFQQAEQAPAGEHLLVSRKMAVMGLVADISGRRQRHGIDDLAIMGRVLIKVHNGQKVRGLVGLVASPDVQHRFFLAAFMLCKGIANNAKRQQSNDAKRSIAL